MIHMTQEIDRILNVTHCSKTNITCIKLQRLCKMKYRAKTRTAVAHSTMIFSINAFLIDCNDKFDNI